MVTPNLLSAVSLFQAETREEIIHTKFHNRFGHMGR